MIFYRKFFNGTLPISFHGHVTDAASPITVAGMLMRLALAAKCDGPDSIHSPAKLDRAGLASLLDWTEVNLETPRWAVIQDSYAGGFGCMVCRVQKSHHLQYPPRYVHLTNSEVLKANLSAQPAFRDHATGSPAINVKVVGQSMADLSALLSIAKLQGCIGVVVEIVSNQFNGRVTTPKELHNLSQACRENGLILVIDETITALRCGAPFAHQRPEYKDIEKPDLVFFGKALGINGIGINFDGPYMRRLGIEAPSKKSQAIYDWQAVVTQPIYVPVLIDAIGVLEMAKAGDWVGRSKIIGQHLRDIALERARLLTKDGARSEVGIIGGLESFIFVHKDVAETFLVMGASNAGPWVRWVRWLPRMDRQLTDKLTVKSLMSNVGVSKRRYMSQCLEEEGLRPQWCFYCGNSQRETAYPWCRTCCIDICDAEECVDKLRTHKCLV
jgi:hypothetical protein